MNKLMIIALVLVISGSAADALTPLGMSRIEIRELRRNRRELNRKHLLENKYRLGNHAIHGRNSPATLESFRRILLDTTYSPTIYDLMGQEIGELTEEDFIMGDCGWTKLVEDHHELRVGLIKDALMVFYGNAPEYERFELKKNFRGIDKTWKRIDANIFKTGRCDRELVWTFRGHLDAVERWLAARLAEKTLELRSYSLARDGQRYLQGLRAFSQRLVDHKYTARMVRDVRGYRFSGGTLAGLVYFLDENRLTLKPGSRAQLELGRLAHEIIKQQAGKEGLSNPEREVRLSPTPREDVAVQDVDMPEFVNALNRVAANMPN